MSNTITAYFKGRVGVAESVYQNDYGMVIAFDSIDLPAHFDCYFSRLNQEEALPGLGADNRVTIPNSILANPGNVTIHIPLHTGEDDSEVEYVIYFKVIGRARPIDDGTPAQMTAIERALALLSQPITNIEEIVNEALSFTGDTFDEMKAELQEDFDNYTETLEGDLATWKGGVESDIDDVEHDFTVLQNQFDTAVAAVSTDTELTDIRVGDDEVTYTTAGLAVRTQFANLKSDLSDETSARILLAGRVTTAESDIDTLETHKVAQPLDEYNQPTDGTDGQSLRTKGDGTTEWADVGLPTDEQTAQAVSDWLDEHPEATTTVQDGSLTEAKFTDALKLKTVKDYVTPEMFGAKGDGVTDDTQAINDAIDYAIANDKVLYLNKAYAFAEPIIISEKIWIDRNVDGSLKYIGDETNGYAITFDGGNSTAISDSIVNLKLTHNSIDLYGIGGVCVKNHLHGTFSLFVRGFSVGVQFIGDTYDCDYNTVYPILIEDNKIGILLETGATGAINQNTFIGGSVRISSTTSELLNEGDSFNNLIIRSNSSHVANNNTFLGVSFESIGDNYISAYGYYNVFINCRFEGITSASISGDGSMAIGGYDLENVISGNSEIFTFSRGISSIPIERDPFTIKLRTTLDYAFRVLSVADANLFRIDGAGNIIPRGGIYLNIGAHALPIIVSASDSIPSYSNGWYGSIHSCGNTAKEGRLLRVRDGTWQNILYSFATTTAKRPTDDIYAGYMMFDTTLGKPIWYKGNNVWVDATGATV